MTIENRTLADFSQVKLEGNGDLILIPGETSAITIEADPEVFDHLKVEVVDGKLVLGLKSWMDALMHGWKKVKYTLTYRQLESLSISGSGKAEAQKLESDHFQFKVSGSGTLIVEDLQTSKLDVHISGSGNLNLRGKAVQQHIQISGSAKMEAWALESQSAQVQISGSGDLMLKVSDALSVNVSGSGSVRYLGSPTVNQSIQGSGSVKQMR
jgi:hypothetical protein